MDQQENNLLSLSDAAEYLELPETLLKAFVNNGYICYLRREGQTVFKTSELDRFSKEFLCKNRSSFQD